MTAPGILDLTVGGAVITAAAVALLVRDRLASVVTFILLGGLLAALWASVRAPDVALAEAAIGTGVTSALLVDALANRRSSEATTGRGRGRIIAWAAAAFGGAGLVVGLVSGVLSANDSGDAAPLTGAPPGPYSSAWRSPRWRCCSPTVLSCPGGRAARTAGPSLPATSSCRRNASPALSAPCPARRSPPFATCGPGRTETSRVSSRRPRRAAPSTPSSPA